MSLVLALPPVNSNNDRSLTAAVAAQTPRLRAFVRRQVNDLAEVEDIVQDAFAELVAAIRLVQPIENLGGWLMRVARNRIIDRRRSSSRRAAVIDDAVSAPVAAEPDRVLDEWLASTGDGPEAGYARSVLADELMAALDELPAEQREVFIAHELEGQSFKELARTSGLGINTLLGRKHSAVLHLRQRLQAIYDELDR